jgi:hypothetical protein
VVELEQLAAVGAGNELGLGEQKHGSTFTTVRNVEADPFAHVATPLPRTYVQRGEYGLEAPCVHI